MLGVVRVFDGNCLWLTEFFGRRFSMKDFEKIKEKNLETLAFIKKRDAELEYNMGVFRCRQTRVR